jgi:mRNA interferase MazF
MQGGTCVCHDESDWGTPARPRNVVARTYIPDAGDLVWLTFDPQAGHERRGRRPALILSARVYNSKARLAIACPITSQVKGYPFEVPLPPGSRISGVVLADHVKNLDWQARRVVFEAKATTETLNDVRERLRVLLGL